MTAAGCERAAEWGIVVCGVMLAGAILTLTLEPRLVAGMVTLILAIITAWIAWQDMRTFTIADGAILTIAVLAFAARWSDVRTAHEPTSTTALMLLFDAAGPGGLLYLFREVYYRRKGVDGLGFGDVKLAVAGGLLVGAEGFFCALAAASLLALLCVLVARLLTKIRLDGSERLAFGAVLAPALWAVWVLQQLPLLLPSTTG